jgi:cell division protein ZapA
VAELALTINNRGYTVSCDDGQEAHLTNLAAHLDQLVQDLVSQVGQVGEARLLVMASLMVADELAEAYDRIAELERGHDAPPPAAGEAEVAQAVESCASRLEAIAARLEGS